MGTAQESNFLHMRFMVLLNRYLLVELGPLQTLPLLQGWVVARSKSINNNKKSQHTSQYPDRNC